MITDKLLFTTVLPQEPRAQERLSISVIVPTRNEAGNVNALLTALQNAFDATPIEVIFVDDSTDETPQVVEAAVARFPGLNVRIIHRPADQRMGGLGGAVVVGLRAAQAEYACVMDGDMQHPPELVPILLQTALAKRSDLVVATRRSDNSQVAGLNLVRNLISKGLDRIGRIFFPRELRGVSDPLTGFFLIRVKNLKLDELRPKGFKILMDILIRHPNLRRAEIPFHFGERHAGQSKASAAEVWKYFSLLWGLRFGEESLRFIGFAAVGLSGIFVNSAAVYVVTDQIHIHYLISAWIATIVSTLWNFSLTEAWVYRSNERNKGRPRRLGIFFGMNLLALLLRSPIIYLMTTMLGFYYVLSNLISLVILTVLRFALADKIIWGQTPSSSPVSNPELTVWRPLMKKSYSYNIHNIVTVVSEGELPELEPFQVTSDIQEPTISVKIGAPRAQKSSDEKGRYLRYRELFGRLGFEVGIEMGDQIKVIASSALRLSPHVLYTNVIEPLLRWTFVKKGYALVHGATIAFGKQAYMITARTDTGKTTTLLKILAYQRRNSDQAAFLSDDMTIVSPDGMAMTYPKPLTISFHTMRAVNSDTLNFKERLALPFQSRIHSRSGRRFAFFVSKTHLPAATINMLVQMIVPPPKYFVNKLVPKVKMTRKANLTGMFIIERGEEEIVAMKNTDAMDVLLQNCEDAYGFPPYEDLKKFLYIQDGVDLRKKEHEIIRQALGELPATIIRSSTMDWWSQIPTFVNNDQVSHDITRALEVETTPRSRYRRETESVRV
jgi:dolichol-phosphate mannosyltransferase